MDVKAERVEGGVLDHAFAVRVAGAQERKNTKERKNTEVHGADRRREGRLARVDWRCVIYGGRAMCGEREIGGAKAAGFFGSRVGIDRKGVMGRNGIRERLTAQR